MEDSSTFIEDRCVGVILGCMIGDILGTPFEGMEVKGKVKKVTLRGKVVFSEGRKLLGPFGQIIYPSIARG